MKIKRLYRFIRSDGGVTVSTKQPENGEYTEISRLIAEDGFILTNGETSCFCIDTHSPDRWSEVIYIDDANL